MFKWFWTIFSFGAPEREIILSQESHKLVSKTLDRKITMHWTFCTMYIMEETNRKSKKLFIKDLQILKTPIGAPVPKV